MVIVDTKPMHEEDLIVSVMDKDFNLVAPGFNLAIQLGVSKEEVETKLRTILEKLKNP